MSFWNKFAEGLGQGVVEVCERQFLGKNRPGVDEVEALFQQQTKELAAIDDRKKTNTEQYDKALLTLSSGVLVLSIAFLDKIAEPGKTELSWSHCRRIMS